MNIKIGDRFVVQADIYIDGVSYAYGYEIQGGFSEYNIVDQRVLNGDHGNYLIPLKPEVGYAEAALNEPWACIEASYTVNYRTHWLEGGTVWLTGNGAGAELGAATGRRPHAVVVDVTDESFAQAVRAWAKANNVAILEDDGERQFDDIVVFGADPSTVERAFTRLANGATFNIVSAERFARTASLDIGRLHYDNLVLVGTSSTDLSQAYAPIRTQLKADGACWVLGAAGPMGHMHIQRALEMDEKPAVIVATNRNSQRLTPAAKKFAPLATAAAVELTCLSEDNFTTHKAFETALAASTGSRGFDDIVVMALSTSAIEGAMHHLAPDGVMNVFAGLPRGTQAHFDLNRIVFDRVRFTGTSGSSIDDLRHMLSLTERQALDTNSAVAAVAGLEGVAEGIAAVAEGRFAGKIVIYPQIRGLPVTPLADLAQSHPSVFANLRDGQGWTNEAERELLTVMLR